MRDFVVTIQVNVVCLQETKLVVIDIYVVMQCHGPSFDGFSYFPAMETRGGILLAWDSSSLGIDYVEFDTNCLAGLVNLHDGGQWWCMGLKARRTRFNSSLSDRGGEFCAQGHGYY